LEQGLMSRAFVKEQDVDNLEEVPERPISEHPNYVTEAGLAQIEDALAKASEAYVLAYATTKGAIQNFTGGLAQMLAEKGIRANAVASGPIWVVCRGSCAPDRRRDRRRLDTPRRGSHRCISFY
jgi:NAD(P)-dependent dehydrogenase (short-subunit alcohol dehydrogenase family)